MHQEGIACGLFSQPPTLIICRESRHYTLQNTVADQEQTVAEHEQTIAHHLQARCSGTGAVSGISLFTHALAIGGCVPAYVHASPFVGRISSTLFFSSPHTLSHRGDVCPSCFLSVRARRSEWGRHSPLLRFQEHMQLRGANCLITEFKTNIPGKRKLAGSSEWTAI
eukprot:2968420-Pyramimonas_sp.AAC.1